MRIKIAVLADYASISKGDKLNILGIFSQIRARTVPVTHPQMLIVVQYEFESLEAGRKSSQIVLQDEDAKQILSISGELEIPRKERGEAFQLNQIIQLNNVTFPKFGEYEFVVLLDERVEEHIPFRVVPIDETPLRNSDIIHDRG